MHSEILNAEQIALLPLMSQFRREYYLVGGTAIAMNLGHRRSIDFDLFKPTKINHKRNLDKIVAAGYPHVVTRRVDDVDYTEQVDYMIPTPPTDAEIRDRLSPTYSTVVI